MELKELLKQQKENKNWNGKVFICYSNDMILRLRASGRSVADGELFDAKDLDKDQLKMEVKSNQWWIEDNDLCIDPYRI